MQLSEIYLALGQESFEQLLRTVSIGKLRSYQLYDRMKVRLHVSKINSEVLRKIGPKLWTRIASNDEEFATELAQAILISHLELIQKVLDFLGIPHDNGFFAKDSDIASFLKDDWEQRVYKEFAGKLPKSALVFYLNHLGWETLPEYKPFVAAV